MNLPPTAVVLSVAIQVSLPLALLYLSAIQRYRSAKRQQRRLSVLA